MEVGLLWYDQGCSVLKLRTGSPGRISKFRSIHGATSMPAVAFCPNSGLPVLELNNPGYDSDPKRELEDKIERAALHYREKYGRWPNTCYVNPQIVNDQGEELRIATQPKGKIRVLSAPNILLHHFWLGIASNGDGAKQRAVN